MAETEFKVGELIENRYRILSVAGSGGMGTLYRVSDEAQDSEIVALKTVRLGAPMLESPESTERFQREFQILTQLRHPNLVSVHNYGITTKGELYFTMELVQGQDLEHSMRRLEPAATIPIIVQICRALAYLHARGVIHGDLKPLNVLMTDDQVKIVDFGVALEVRTPEVQARYYTPGYAAPETKQLHPVDHRADLYSLGAIWYALLVGEPPMFMPGAGQERLVQFTLDEALEGQDQIPTAISDVITRLLATSPADRYAIANEVIAAVNKVTGSAYALETRETARSYALRGRFVDREAEMEALQAVWEQARFSEGKLVLVSGEAGVGKTRLLEELTVQAEMEGARVARGQCVESGGNAYRPWREVLRVLVRYVEGADEMIVQRVGPVLAALLPELWHRDYMAGAAPPADLDPQAAQQRLNDAIAQVLRAAAGLRPTVVVIENTHWADEATLTLLSFLARAPGQTGLLVCVAYRDEEIGPEHPLAALAGDWVERISLQLLSPEVTTDLVCSMLGLEKLPALLTERVQQTTGGNAFFVQELIRSLAEEGEVLQRTVEGWQVDGTALQETRLPESIRQVVWRRLEHLTAEAQQMLRWAAVVGPMFWDGVVEEIGQVPRERVQATLGEGLEQGLVLERDRSALAGEREYLFTSPTVREVSYESIPREERREVHGRAAAWLIACSTEKLNEHLGLIADHLEKAGQTESAVIYLTRAGEQAAAQFANAEAVGYFSQALDLTPAEELASRYALLLAREKVHDLQGAREAQTQDLVALEGLARALADDQRRAEVALRQAHYLDVIGDYPASIAADQEAIRLAQAAQDMNNETVGYMQWGITLWRQGDNEAARLQLKQALTLAQSAGLRQVKADNLLYLGVLSVYQGEYAEAIAFLEQALRIEREMGDRQGESSTLNTLGIAARSQGDYAEGRACFEQALRISREIGDWRSEGMLLDSLALLLHQSGDDEAARECSQQALVITQKVGDRRMQAYALTTLGHALAGLGRLAEASDAYQQAVILRRELGQHNLAIESLAGLARVTLAQGDLSQAQGEEILSYLEANTPSTGPSASSGQSSGHGLDGTEEPLRVYLTCYRILRANQGPRAETILNTAHRLLQEQAAKISDEELRRSFLENVAVHREIVSEFAKGK